MKVLFYRYNSICEPIYINALKDLGLEVLEETAQMREKDLTGPEQFELLKGIFQREELTFVMSINYFPVLSSICNIYQIPYVSIVVDSPLMDLYSDTIKNPWNRIFIFDYALWARHVDDNPECIFHMPLVADYTHMQQVIRKNGHLKSQYSADVSFIGSLYTEKCPYDKLKGLSDYTKGYCDGLIGCQQKIYGYNMIYEMLPDAMVEEFKQCEGIYRFPENAREDYRALMAYDYLGVKASQIDRVKLLQAVSERYALDLYTGSNVAELPKAKHKGLASSMFDMPLIFSNSKINLQITARTIETGLSQRVWDVLACGGFLLMNFQQELFNYFEPGKDMDFFESQEDLVEKIAYYLEHEDERQEIAKNGMEKVKKYHMPMHRMNEILKRVVGGV